MVGDEALSFRARALNDRARQEVGEEPIYFRIDEAAVALTPDHTAGIRIHFGQIRKIRFGFDTEESWFRNIVRPQIRVWTQGDREPLVIEGVDESTDQRRFVRAAYARIRQVNPQAIIETGSSASLWLLVVLGIVLTGALVYLNAPIWASIAVGAASAWIAYVIHKRLSPRLVVSRDDLERAMPRVK